MDKQLFSTADFYLAAFLSASNYKMEDFFRRNGYTTFIYRETPELKELVKNYYSESTLIEPVKYGRSVKNLKSMLHSASLSTSKSVNQNEFYNNLKGTK